MPKRPAKYAEIKPQRGVRRNTLPVKPASDEIKRAFEEARGQMHCGFGITRAARDELMFRAGYGCGFREGTKS